MLEFADSYLGFLYGGSPAAAVAPITDRLRAQLRAGHSMATPAELRRVVVVQAVEVTSNGPRAARASAVVDDGASPPYTITFNLSLSHGSWLVTAVESLG